MTIIEMLICWFKARFSDLTDKEFCALCKTYKLTSTPLERNVLQTYFRRHTPSNSRINAICEGSWALKQIYMLSIPRNRALTPYEQHCMVFFMPVGGPYHFPSPLDTVALKELFETARPYKIAAYARDFVLPEQFEARLIELCRKESPKRFPLNSYQGAMLYYLSFNHGKRLVAPNLQQAVLNLGDEKLSKALINACSFDTCVLSDEAINTLIAAKDEKLLSELLFKSYVASPETVQKLLSTCPQLKWQYEISKLRKPLRQLEKAADQFLGIEAPTMSEHQFILHCIDTSAQTEDREEFVNYKLLPKLKNSAGSPYFCAWAAHNFPETAEKAYQCVRTTAEYLHKHYKQ